MRTAAQAVAWAKAQCSKPSRDWTGWCQMFVRMSFGQAPSGVPDAHAGWARTKQKVTNGSTPPAGAPVYWKGGAHGHAALSAGGGYVYSTDIRRRGKVDRVPIKEIAQRWNYKLSGWGKDYVGTLIDFGVSAPPAPQAAGVALGIDIARYQDGISFSAAAKALDFMYVKCSEGQQSVSKTWGKQWNAANSAKILVGAYHFAGTDAKNRVLGSPITEARNFANRLKAANFKPGYHLPPVLDMENDGRKSKADLTQWCLDFCQEVDRILGLTARGSWQRTGVYLNTTFYNSKLDGRKVISGRWQWRASWSSTYAHKWPPLTAMPSGAHMWQFTDKISVAGKTCDGDIAPLSSLRKWAPLYFGAGEDEFDMATLADLKRVVIDALQNHKVKPGEAASRIGKYSEALQKNGATLYQYAIGADCKGNAALERLDNHTEALTFLSQKLLEVASKPALSPDEMQSLAAEVVRMQGKLVVEYKLPEGTVIP